MKQCETCTHKCYESCVYRLLQMSHRQLMGWLGRTSPRGWRRW